MRLDKTLINSAVKENHKDVKAGTQLSLVEKFHSSFTATLINSKKDGNESDEGK